MQRCPKCAAEMDEGKDYCPKCGNQCSAVQILTPQERELFHGVTIQDEEAQGGPCSEYESAKPRQRVYVRHVQIDSTGPSGFFVKLIFLALVLLFIFIFLPMALLLVAAGILGWFILRLLKR